MEEWVVVVSEVEVEVADLAAVQPLVLVDDKSSSRTFVTLSNLHANNH